LPLPRGEQKGRIRRVKYPGTAIVSLFLSASFALADDFKTIHGKEYKNVTVTRVEPDGIVLKTKSGIAKIYFIELPKDAQERFGYNVRKPSTDQNSAPEQRRKQQETPLATPSTPAVVSSAATTQWAYSEHADEMGRGTTKLAQVVSSNTVRFGFPYEGEIHAAIQLRKSPKYGQDVMLRVARGQFVSSYTKNFVTVRFDDGELAKFAIREPEDGTTGLLFIRPDDAEFFIRLLRRAIRVKIEADFYQEGPRVFEFDVHGLDW